MISDKTFTLEEFQAKIPEFAQALINKCSVKDPKAKLQVIQQAPAVYLIILTDSNNKTQTINIFLAQDGKVETVSVI